MQLLKNSNTEIVLFLPVMQMYRFTSIALTDYERTCYNNLRNFIQSFFPPEHFIHQDKVDNIFEYINEIKKALSFNNQYFTCSHYIEREPGQYYALFYISPHIYGLDKMIEAKWSADPVGGKGFKQEKIDLQFSMFSEQFKEFDKRKQLDFLKEEILNYLKENREINNITIYKLALTNEFKPSHANSVLKELIKGGRVKISSQQSTGGQVAFGITYDNYHSNNVRAIFSIN